MPSKYYHSTFTHSAAITQWINIYFLEATTLYRGLNTWNNCLQKFISFLTATSILIVTILFTVFCLLGHDGRIKISQVTCWPHQPWRPRKRCSFETEVNSLPDYMAKHSKTRQSLLPTVIKTSNLRVRDAMLSTASVIVSTIWQQSGHHNIEHLITLMKFFYCSCYRWLTLKKTCLFHTCKHLQDAIKLELPALMHHIMENIWDMNWLQR